MMETIATEMATNPSNKLLIKYGEASGACQIEQLFKPAAFSLETAPSPSLVGYSKRCRLNMNVAPDDHYQPQRH